jgi:hypothetical protein
MNLYFQLLTLNQSADATILTALPPIFSKNKVVGGKGKISSGGKLSYFSFSNIESLKKRMLNARFNECEVKYDVTHVIFGDLELKINSIDGVFKPAPTNDSWLYSDEFNVSNKSSKNRQMNASNIESAYQKLGLKQGPSVFEVAFDLETQFSHERVLRECALSLGHDLPRSFNSLQIFGCCDAGGKELIVRLESHVIMADHIRMFEKIHPKDYTLLGQKIDALHPIMFGRRDLFSELHEVLGHPALLFEDRNNPSFAVIYLSQEFDSVAATARAKRFFLSGIK